jgi:hypothetical protein
MRDFGMTLSSPLPDPQRRIDELTLALQAADERGDRLEAELRAERRKNANTEKGVAELRKLLAPFYQWLGMVFGHIDAMGLTWDGSANSSAPKNSAVWESWKQQLGGKTGAAIDVLLLHGEMSAQQLRIHLKCGNEYVYKVITKLANANLINRREGKISLKEL